MSSQHISPPFVTTSPESFHPFTEVMDTIKPLPPPQSRRLNDQELLLEKGPFSISANQLSELHNPKNFAAFQTLGGLFGLVEALHTDVTTGLSVDETSIDDLSQNSGPKVATTGSDNEKSTSTHRPSYSGSHSQSKPFGDRITVFGTNHLPEKKSKSFLHTMWDAFNDKVLILLTVVAVISLALGLYQSFGTYHKPGKSRVDWVEGVAIMVAVVVIVLVSALNDFQKEKQFVRLNKKVRLRCSFI